jgi:transcriptional regulator with XRE-family HTH domain
VNKPRIKVRDLELLNDLAAAHGVTHRDIARAAGWSSHTYVGRLLRGESTAIEPTPAARIARFFGVPVRDLFMPKPTQISGRNNPNREDAA